QVQPPQPDPMKTRELDIKDKLAQASLLTAQASLLKAQRSAAYDSGKLELDQHRLAIDSLDQDRENNRHDIELSSRIALAERELELEEAQPDASTKAIVSASI